MEHGHTEERDKAFELEKLKSGSTLNPDSIKSVNWDSDEVNSGPQKGSRDNA